MMVMRRAMLYVACAAASGCGRLGFDSPAGPATTPGADGAVARDGLPGDAAGGPPGDAVVALHDEDADGIFDSMDNCPHLANATQLDSDGDGVGDACDPNPTVARDHIAFFDPFTGPRPEWTSSGPPPSYPGDTLVIDTTSGSLFITSIAATAGQNDVYMFGGHVLATGTGEKHLMLGLGELPFFPPTGPTSAYYYCEVCFGGVCGGQTYYALTHTFDNATWTADQRVNAQLLGPGAFALEFEQAVPKMGCQTSWPANASTLSGNVPSGISPVAAGMKLIGVKVELDYFIQIHSD